MKIRAKVCQWTISTAEMSRLSTPTHNIKFTDGSKKPWANTGFVVFLWKCASCKPQNLSGSHESISCKNLDEESVLYMFMCVVDRTSTSRFKAIHWFGLHQKDMHAQQCACTLLANFFLPQQPSISPILLSVPVSLSSLLRCNWRERQRNHTSMYRKTLPMKSTLN